ncbi:MAG: nucleotidyltransferase family protein [Planctomycetes bacterium]|nr:nucleotidyltransferase family protein [Planctomycetota bacterium]
MRPDSTGVAREFLRDLLALDPAPDALARVRARPPEGRDWDAVLRLAAQARTLPLLHWHHRRHTLGWPEEVAGRLRAAYAQSAARAHGQEEVVRDLCGRFASAGVRAVLLKGAALRRHLYPDPALRPMADIDFWIHPADVKGADAALREAGHARRDPDEAWEAMRRFGLEATYVDGDGNLSVEIHWGLEQYERYRGAAGIDPDRLWSASRPDPDDPSARFLPLALEPSYLAFHAGAVHGFQGTLWRLDLAEWLRRYRAEVDWDTVIHEARSAGFLNALKMGTGTLYPKLMPPLFCGEAEYTVPTGLSRLRPLLALPTWRDRARAVARGLFPSAESRAYRMGTDTNLFCG